MTYGILSESIAGLPVHVYQYTGTSGKEKTIKHPVSTDLQWTKSGKANI